MLGASWIRGNARTAPCKIAILTLRAEPVPGLRDGPHYVLHNVLSMAYKIPGITRIL